MKMALATAPPIADDRAMTLRRHMLTALLSSIIALVPGWAGRARAETAPVAKPPPCATAAHQQFDFWLGQWEVRDPAGKVVGHNRIETAHGGCALIEHWTSVTGVTGTSVNIYDRDRRQWHQTWVDSCSSMAAAATLRWCSPATHSMRTRRATRRGSA
jgi:hypothetical protein